MSLAISTLRIKYSANSTVKHMPKHKKKKGSQTDRNRAYDFIIGIVSGIILVFLIQPMLSQFLLYSLHMAVVPPFNYPLENTRPRIELFYPQNLESFSYNDSITLWAKLTDEGGSGVDYNLSSISLQKGEQPIALMSGISLPDKIVFHPSFSLVPGKYTMHIIAKDRSGNTEEQLADFIINEKPKIQLEVYPVYPIIENNQTYARFIVRNVGSLPLVGFSVGFIDPNNRSYSWGKQSDNLLLPADKVEVLLPVKLNLSCDYTIHANGRLFVGSNLTKYLLINNNTQSHCAWGEISLKTFSLKSNFKEDLGTYPYPFYEDINGFEFTQESNLIVLHNETEIPLGATSVDIFGFSPDSFCGSKPTKDFDWCYNMSSR